MEACGADAGRAGARRSPPSVSSPSLDGIPETICSWRCGMARGQVLSWCSVGGSALEKSAGNGRDDEEVGRDAAVSPNEVAEGFPSFISAIVHGTFQRPWHKGSLLGR